MSYIIGIDGGGTKTRGVLLSSEGVVKADLSVGPSNYQMIGSQAAQDVLKDLVDSLINAAGVEPVKFIYYGLSGADLPHDFLILNGIATTISNSIPFEIGNDTWCVFRSALHQSWGAVSLYGTGANAAAMGMDGQQFILRALNYVAGGFGGGDEIASTALHYAFRSEEGTYKFTLLEKELPKLLNCSDMEGVLNIVYPEFCIDDTHFKKIPPLVFDLAGIGDSVCIEILENHGRIQGELVSGMIVKSNLHKEAVPVVTGGSVFKGSSPYFVNAMMSQIHLTAPLAYEIKPYLPPVCGAALMACERAGFNLDDDFYKELHRQY